MEPYILVRTTVTNYQAESQQRARAKGEMKPQIQYPLKQIKKVTRWYLNTSMTSAERVCEKGTRCCW